MANQLCGASSTSVCVLPAHHDGLCSYWADSELNKQLKAERDALRAEVEGLRQEKHDWDMLERANARTRGEVDRLRAAFEAILVIRGSGVPMKEVREIARHALAEQKPRYEDQA